jgi:hypothetical protein
MPPDEYVRDYMIQPIGGLRALADSPTLDQVRIEISGCVRGHPMLAGLSFYLIAAIDEHHKDLSLSYNETYRIFSGTFPHLRLQSVDNQKSTLPRWHCVAPRGRRFWPK